MKKHATDSQDETPSSLTPSRKKRLIRIAVWLLGVPLVAAIGLGIFLDAYGQVERARPAQAIVILGARVTAKGLPGDSLTARTLHAVQLYRQHLAPKIICTGGVGDHPPAEAVAAAELAKAQDVPAADLLLETTSTSTMENVRNAVAICRQQGWTRVIVVSDPYHLWRARRDFALVGITAYPSPARNCLRNTRTLLRIEWVARETLLVIRDVFTNR